MNRYSNFNASIPLPRVIQAYTIPEGLTPNRSVPPPMVRVKIVGSAPPGSQVKRKKVLTLMMGKNISYLFLPVEVY